jgi:hypothetical protein
MDKIMIFRDESKKASLWVPCLRMLSPECEIQVLSRQIRHPKNYAEPECAFHRRGKRDEDG